MTLLRVRPCLIASLGLVLGWGLSPAMAGDAVRLAQRWTPLTGMLPPADSAPEINTEAPKETGATRDPPPKRNSAPVTEAGTPPASGTTIAGAQRLSLSATLERTVADGPPHGSLGVRTTTVDSDLAEGLGLGPDRGAMISETSSAKPAKLDLRVGDIVLGLDGRAIAGAEALTAALRDSNAGQSVSLDIWRAGEGASDLKTLLVKRAADGNVGAAASLGRLLSLGLVLGPRDFGEAARYYLEAAEHGHLASMTRYALLARDGIGVPKDEKLAAKWFLSAAERGQEAAMTNLGTLYESGRGATQDYAEAARWYRKAADLGHPFAMHKLALLYEQGKGVPKDDDEAVRLLSAASDKGLSEATSWLADKYAQGRGIPKNEDEALALNTRAADQVRRAADQGNAVATFNLGLLYRIGKGVKKSDTEAAYWVVRSLKLGDKYLVSELMRNPNVLSVADRKWLQEVLRDEGTYKGPIDGSFNPDVRTAMEELGKKV